MLPVMCNDGVATESKVDRFGAADPEGKENELKEVDGFLLVAPTVKVDSCDFFLDESLTLVFAKRPSNAPYRPTKI